MLKILLTVSLIAMSISCFGTTCKNTEDAKPVTDAAVEKAEATDAKEVKADEKKAEEVKVEKKKTEDVKKEEKKEIELKPTNKPAEK